MNKNKTQMRAKRILVSLLAIASFLLLMSTVSALDITSVTVDGVEANSDDAAVIAGETVTIKVYFTAEENETDVRVKAEIEGEKVDVDARTDPFDVEDTKDYKKVLTLRVPYELKDEVSDDVDFNVKIWNGDLKVEESYTLRVQRPSYNVEIKSIVVDNRVEAGETVPVDIVIKNRGYNALDDLYVTIKVPALDIEKKAYFGDLVALEGCNNECDDDDDEDSVTGRIYLKIPYDAVSGDYSLEVEVENEDMTVNEVKQITVRNDFSGNVVSTVTGKTVGVGQEAEYSFLLVNPTNKLKVFRIVPENTGDLSVNADESVVAVSAGSSRTVTITAKASAEGQYRFNVNVFSGEELAEKAEFSLTAEKSTVANPIIVLTIILVIVFLVLLIILFVLIGKKPEKNEEFGESYY